MLAEALKRVRVVSCREQGPEVERTVANMICADLAPDARPVYRSQARPQVEPGCLHVGVAPDDLRKLRPGEWMSFTLRENGSGSLMASHPHWLYALSALLEEKWVGCDERAFAVERIIRPSFPWFRNLNDFLVGSLRRCRHIDRESYIRKIARLGFSHVAINGLGVDRPFESGPPGDRYSWFYDYSPDLDQFVESTLLKGYYPPDYLRANLDFLKSNAALARKYGLTPGLHINSPRSMPEDFWSTYGFLRGARVDHPRESFRPRYTLAMAHPVVQRHYRELMRGIMREIPEIGFVHIWTNDSGSGFEFVSSLYAGRNGGPYLIREWRTEDQIAQAAAGNVLTYYRLLRDEGRAVNPEFRLICDLGPFSVERPYIVPALGDGIDAGDFGYFENTQADAERAQLAGIGAMTHLKTETSNNNVIGLPCPLIVHERLKQAIANGAKALLCDAAPSRLVPYDINAEALRAAQLFPGEAVVDVLRSAANRWAGESLADTLMDIWRMSDAAVRNYPTGIPMSTFGFPWFRLWVRPFVPNIDALTEAERAYYEPFLLATFNNPARIDLNNDMMWNFLTVQEAGEFKRVIDVSVLPPLAEAIRRCRETLSQLAADAHPRGVFTDLADRLRAGRAYHATMRNTMAWTESVHGYIAAATPEVKTRFRALCREMVENETANARELLALWNESHVDFMPVSDTGETLHIYGENFGMLLQRKIALMEEHRDDEPYIDPGFMWRMPA